MTPYNKETTAIVDPSIPIEKFLFGPISQRLVETVGIVKESYHSRLAKSTVYGIKYPHLVKLVWFAEKEITPIYQT